MAEFEINGVKLNLDFMDADDAEKAETEILNAKSIMDNINGEGIKDSEAIRTVCSVVSTCFDNIFGAGTGDQVLLGKKNLKTAMDAILGLIEERQKQGDQLMSKYSPNRLERRHPSKK
jgi:hypothetical protein